MMVPTKEQLSEARKILLAGHKAFLDGRGGAPIEFNFEDLRGAQFVGTDFTNASFTDSDFTNAYLNKCNFHGADFEWALNLDATKNMRYRREVEKRTAKAERNR